MARTVVLTLAEACTAHKKDIERYVPLAECPTAMRYCLQPHDIRTLVNDNSSWTTTIPASLAPGEYFIRHEVCKSRESFLDSTAYSL